MDRIVLLGLGYIGFSLVLALSLPPAPLSSLPWLLAPIDVVASVVPSIRKYADLSDFPQVTLVYLSIGWASIPVLMLLFWRRLEFSLERARAAAPREGKIAFTLGPLIMLAGIAFTAIHAPSPEALASGELGLDVLVARAASSSRVALGALGGCFFFAVAVLAVLSVKVLVASTRLWKAAAPDRDSKRGSQ